MSAYVQGFLLALARDSFAAAVLIGLVLATQRIFRRQLSPYWHCALWLLVVARLLPLSFGSQVSLFNLLPRWSALAPVGVWAESAAINGIPPLPASNSSPIPADETGGPDAASLPRPTVAIEEISRGFFAELTWPKALFFSWLAGVIALAGYVLAGSISFSRLLRRRQPLDDPAALAVLHDCCARLGMRRAPTVVSSDAVRTPALHGLLRPQLLLPVGFTARYSAQEQQFVFLHELAHLRRHDLLLNWIISGLQILHWFNPLIWFGFSRWRVDREIACDAAALEAAGANHNRAYGQTMLRLLEHLSEPVARPGVVGILEDRRQLQRRMTMITGFVPARRPVIAVALLAILATVGLTDAQVPPSLPAAVSSSAGPMAVNPPERTSLVPPAAPYVLFLINGSEAMLRELNPTAGLDANGDVSVERGRTFLLEANPATDDQKRASAKWLRAAGTLEAMLTALPVETHFHVALFFDDRVEPIGGRSDAHQPQAIPDTLERLRRTVPRGAPNLESAFAFVADSLNAPRPERIVLITDGLPTTSLSAPGNGDITEAQRIRCFQLATSRLPPRVPVHTVLLPSAPGDPGAAGLYWELANATRGGLTCPPNPGTLPRTHLAFVIDTSGSMRNPNGGGLWPGVIDTLEAVLDANPDLTGLQLLDGDGRFVLGRRGTGAAGWLPNTPGTRDAIKGTLRRYNQDTVSNPVPGIYNAIRFLQDKAAPELRMAIWVFGDEFNSADSATAALRRLDELNPVDAAGQRPVVINAYGFPTTIRYQYSMGNTGLRFANLMRVLTSEHGGSFVALPDL